MTGQALNNLWVPANEEWALMVEIPLQLEQIPNMETLLGLVAKRVQILILEAEDPEEAVQYMITELDMAGLIDPYLNKKKLIQGDLREIENLLDRPKLEWRLKSMTELEPKDFPLQPNGNQEALETWEDMTLNNWTDNVVPRLV